MLAEERDARADAPFGQPAHINAGDLLIDFGTWNNGEETFGEESDSFDILASDGTYRGSLELPGIGEPDIAFENVGSILHSYGLPIVRFSHDGGQASEVIPPDEIDFPTILRYALDVPENIYAAVYVNDTQQIWKYPRSGGGFGTPVEVEAAPWLNESYVMSVIGLSGCTLSYGGIDLVKRYDICTNTQLADYASGPETATGHTRVLPDLSLLTVEDGQIKRIEVNGDETIYDGAGCYESADAYDGVVYAVDVCGEAVEAFDLETGDFIEVVRQYSSGDIAARGGAYPIGVRVYDRVAPAKPVIFVHGVKENATEAGFGGLEAALGPNPEPPLPQKFERTPYYQDKAETCPETAPGIDPESTIDDALWSGSGYFDACDSQGDIGKSAVKLHALVKERFAASGGQQVILIGYSQGVATIRGMLAYSQELDDSVASGMVDSAFFIEGVHHGSLFANTTLLAHDGLGYLGGTLLQSAYEEAVTAVGEFELGRPAIHQLAANSDWFKWSADPARVLPEIGYYNAYGDLRVTDKNCINLWLWGDCYTADLLSLGDLIVQSGSTDDPYYLDVPFAEPVWKGGGARFSRPNTTEQWQWPLRRDFDIKKWKMAAFTPLIGSAAELVRFGLFVKNAPELHTAIGSKAHLTSITDCSTGQPTNLEAQIIRIVKGKRGEEAYACPLHE
jgi:predicted esterase